MHSKPADIGQAEADDRPPDPEPGGTEVDGHQPGSVRRIHMWSSPRNVSTAMMYAWRERSDTTVVDEPLYAYYLYRTGRSHPGFDEVVASQVTDGDVVVRDVLQGPCSTPVIFFKQMAKHLLDLDRGFFTSADHILLTRDPHEMLASLQVNLDDITLADTGFTELVEILDWAVNAGRQPIVVDSGDLLAEPEAMLQLLCHRLGLAYDPAMLRWPSGPKPEDGVWAKYWYARAHESTGWVRPTPSAPLLRDGLELVLDQATALYERLLPYSLQL